MSETSLKTNLKKTAIRKALVLDRRLTDSGETTQREPALIPEAIAAYKDYLVTERRSEKTKTKYWAVFDHVASMAQDMKRSSLLELDLSFIDKYRAERAKSCQPRTIYTETVIIDSSSSLLPRAE